jgi:ribonuclease E
VRSAANEAATSGEAALPGFADTQPNGASGEASESERQGGRRRRRGGRGRDRDREDGFGDRVVSPPAEGIGEAEATTHATANEAAVRDERARAAAIGEGAIASSEEGRAGAPAFDQADASEQRGEGSRRRRGGRGRDHDRAPREGEPAAANDSFAANDEVARSEQSEHANARGERIRSAGAEREQRAPAEPVATPALAREDAWRLPEPSPRFAPQAEERAAPPEPTPAPSAEPAQPYALPIDSLAAVAESAGLQWVNSDVTKIQAAQAAIAATPAPVRVPREIAPVAAIDEGPLVLVETKKDLAQVKLPFETTAEETQGL